MLDDDPTGTQTVHNVPVLTTWSVDALSAELMTDASAFYVLTNSRSLPSDAAQALVREIGANLKAAMRATGRDAVVISRSNSTLRGHFPAEVDTLTSALDLEFDACLLIPCFFEGGRYTVDDVHYVQEGDEFVPAAETPFAQDAAFGYRESNLRDWVEEKTAGRVPASDVASISIDLLRRGAPEQVRDALLDLKQGAVCVVNAADYSDLEMLVQALLDAEAAGRRFIYRTAASFVRVRAGIAPRPLLTRDEIRLDDGNGALVVVGSYVPKTTRQLSALLRQPDVHSVEIDVRRLIDPHARADEIERVTAQAEAHLSRNHATVVFTRRELITGADAEDSSVHRAVYFRRASRGRTGDSDAPALRAGERRHYVQRRCHTRLGYSPRAGRRSDFPRRSRVAAG